jgi:hypothetical protein
VKMDIKEKGWDVVGWIYRRTGDMWHTFVNTVMNIWFA